MSLKRFAAALSVAMISVFTVSAFAQAPTAPPAAPKMDAKMDGKMDAKSGGKMAKSGKKSGKKTAKKEQPRDAKGHFVKATPAPSKMAAPAPKSGVVMDKNGRAHDAKTGKFVKMDKKP